MPAPVPGVRGQGLEVGCRKLGVKETAQLCDCNCVIIKIRATQRGQEKKAGRKGKRATPSSVKKGSL